MVKYALSELAAIYHNDCGAGCDKCPLGKPIVTIPEHTGKLPADFTLCYLFDYMNLNRPEKK